MTHRHPTPKDTPPVDPDAMGYAGDREHEYGQHAAEPVSYAIVDEDGRPVTEDRYAFMTTAHIDLLFRFPAGVNYTVRPTYGAPTK